MPLAKKVKESLGESGKGIRIVSVPCLEIFEKQKVSYKNYVLPKNVTKRLCIEAGSGVTLGQLAGDVGKVVNVDTFGVSASMNEVYKYFHFTVKDIAKKL